MKSEASRQYQAAFGSVVTMDITIPEETMIGTREDGKHLLLSITYGLPLAIVVMAIIMTIMKALGKIRASMIMAGTAAVTMITAITTAAKNKVV
jgi:hypothetical protein